MRHLQIFPVDWKYWNLLYRCERCVCSATSVHFEPTEEEHDLSPRKVTAPKTCRLISNAEKLIIRSYFILLEWSTSMHLVNLTSDKRLWSGRSSSSRAWELPQLQEGSHAADQDRTVGIAQTQSKRIVLSKTRDDSDRLLGNTCHDSRQYMCLSFLYINWRSLNDWLGEG